MGEVGEIIAGGDIEKERLCLIGKYPVIANSLFNKGIIGYYGDYKIEAPAVTITGRGDTGIAIAREQNFTPVVRLLVLKPKKNYYIYFLENAINIIKKYDESTGVPQLTVPQIKNFKILVPNIQEQTKIGNFFKSIDDLITIHQEKLENLKKLKKSLLQKMFPKNGNNLPEIRFPEFTDTWEQCKLGDIVKITMGQSPDSKNYTNNPKDYILVQGNADIQNGYVFPKIWTSQITKQSKKGDLILTVRAPVGEVAKTEYDVVIGRGVASISGNEFIYQRLILTKEKGDWNKVSTGSTFDSINSNNIKELSFSIPFLKEQTKIGNFFKSVDDLITIHQGEYL